METVWSIHCDEASEAFAETLAFTVPGDATARQFWAAYDDGVAWQDDLSGFAMQLEKEDVDKQLLSTWIRTGQVRNVVG